jgi:hypothetical protein
MSMRVRLTASVIAAVALGSSAGAQAPLAIRIKAAVVSKFPQFVEWPPAALDGRHSVELCVASDDPILPALQDIVAGDTVSGRPVGVRRVEHEVDLDGCQLLFVPEAAFAGHRGLLQQAARRPVLTVGDDQRFLDQGGIIRLREVNGRLRFDINAAAAQHAGLKISAQLLQLAVSVREDGR